MLPVKFTVGRPPQSGEYVCKFGAKAVGFGLYEVFMAKEYQKKADQQTEPIDKTVADFVKGLSDEHKMLVVLKSQLYGGSWTPMLDDLNNRLAGKPYIFKLVNRIKDDVDRIEEMRVFENTHDVDLSEYVSLS